MITVVGWPRSGTHWMKVMLESALGEELAHDHHLPQEKDGLYVMMLRDPMDTFWSHWNLYRHDSPGQCTELGFFDMLMRGQMESHQGWNIGWVPYVHGLLAWHQDHPSTAPLVRYEQLYRNPDHILAQTIDGLGFGVCYERSAGAVHKTLGVRCDPSGLSASREMGKPGAWIEHLRAETVDALLNYCGPMMTELGYL